MSLVLKLCGVRSAVRMQVAVACEERGRLMADVWQGFAGALGGAVARLTAAHAGERTRCAGMAAASGNFFLY